MARSTTLETGKKPLAPGTNIHLDSVSGDDTLSGFGGANAVLTLGRIQDILETYDWDNASSVNLRLDNGDNLGTLNLKNVTGLQEFNVRGTVNDGFAIDDFRGKVDFFSCTIDNLVTCRDIYRLRFDNNTFNNLGNVNIQQCFDLETDNNIYNSLTSTKAYQLSNVYRAKFDPAGFVGGNFTDGFVRIVPGGCCILQFASGASGTVTGILVKVDDFFGLTTALVHYSNNGSISGTIPDVFPAGTIYNNDLSRGDFIDDAAAGAGGVLSGHYYWNTTSGQLDRKI